MNGHTQQTALLSNTQQLLRDAEVEFCRLKADKEALEIRLSEVDPYDVSRTRPIREELRALMDRMNAVQIEQMEHRVTLLREQLPHDREAVQPLQTAFDQADRDYREAYSTRETAAVALHNAKLRVSNAESNIDFYQTSIERLRKQLTTSQGSRARLTSEIDSEITGLESRLRELRIMAPQQITDTAG